MAIGSGLSAQIGVKAESTYGTPVTVDRFYEFSDEDLKKQNNIVQGGGLAAGRFAQLGSRRIVASQAASGSVSMEIANKSMGVLLNQLMGGTATVTQQAATAAYLQSHPLVDNATKYLTVQKGVPDTGGTVRPYTFCGGKVLGAEFSCGVDEILTSKWDFDFQRAIESEAIATASYPAGLAPFHFAQMSVKLGTLDSEAAVTGVKKVTLKIERGQATDRFYAGATVAGTKANPLTNDYVKVSGSFDVDYITKADFADRFAADSSTALIWEFVGPVIASTYYQTFRIKVPMIFLDGDTPSVNGPGIVSGSFPFVGQSDGSSAVATIEYISTDTAI